MELIFSILEVLFGIITDDNDIVRIIIIDNIYNNSDYIIQNLTSIINFINNKKSNIKLIISGEGPYFNQKFIDFYAKNHVLINDKDILEHELKECIYIYCANYNEYNIIMNNDEKKKKSN